MRALKIRTGRGMIALSAPEARELRERLRLSPAARPASQTIAVSANASTSVTLTDREKAAVFDVLTGWAAGGGGNGITEGPLELRSALAHDLGLDDDGLARES
jgi:hypothetical protein